MAEVGDRPEVGGAGGTLATPNVGQSLSQSASGALNPDVGLQPAVAGSRSSSSSSSSSQEASALDLEQLRLLPQAPQPASGGPGSGVRGGIDSASSDCPSGAWQQQGGTSSDCPPGVWQQQSSRGGQAVAALGSAAAAATWPAQGQGQGGAAAAGGPEAAAAGGEEQQPLLPAGDNGQ